MALFWLASAWLAGVAAGPLLQLRPFQWGALAALSSGLLLLQRRARPARFVFALLLAAALGAGRAALASPTPPPLAAYNDSSARLSLRGWIADYPEERAAYTGLTLEVEGVRSDDGAWTPTSGRVLARADRFTPWRYGDEVVVTGRLNTPPEFEGFSYRAYLARRKIHSLVDVESGERLAAGGGNAVLRAIYALRRRAHGVVAALFPEPEASLLAGILLGIESGIPGSVRADFDATGTTHIIAISGFNITIIAGISILLLGRWLGARRGALAAGLAIGLYTVFVGADAAVVRAALMGGLALSAQLLGRRAHGFASLGSAAVVMTALNPTILADVGFQLSFAATLGLLLYGERFQEGFETMTQNYFQLSPTASKRLAGPASEYLLLTLAAQITTLPLMIYHFGRLSIVSPLANLIILPAQPPLMVLGGLATVGGLLWLPLGRSLAWLAWPFPAFTIRAVEAFAELPIASLALPQVSLPIMGGLYAAILILTVMGAGQTAPEEDRPPSPVRWSLLLLILGAGATLAWRTVTDQPDGRLHLTFLEIEQGSGILLETPAGRHVLINGGGSAVELGQRLDRRLSLLSRDLDWIILTATDEEQIGGVVRLIERYQVGGALIAGVPQGSAYRALAAELATTGRPVGRVKPGTVLALGMGAELEFVPVGEEDLGLWLAYGRTQFLLVPSAEPGWTDHLPLADKPATVTALLPPEGGDAAISPPDALLAINPQLLILAVEPGNTQGLPPTSLLAAAGDRTLLRTDRHGWIHVSTDGRRLWTEVERTSPSESP